jgi:hypothetical protein
MKPHDKILLGGFAIVTAVAIVGRMFFMNA